MRTRDAYRELGVDPEASDAEVKAAWRRAAARWHPDRNASPQAKQKIQRINAAMEQIRRSRSRVAVAAGSEDEDEAPPAAAPSREAEPDVFDEHELTVTLDEAAVGCSRVVTGVLEDACAACSGSGTGPLATCATCAGEGRVRQQLFFGWLAPFGTCRACEGRGVARAPCPDCAGSGRSECGYRCRVQVPAGVRDGDVVHATAPVHSGGVARTLGLRLRVALAPHPLFTLQADGTLQCTLPVDGFAWMANRWIEVPTPGGLQQMRLRRGALVYRIRGQGLPAFRGGARADCLVTVEPVFPEALSREQEAWVDRLVASNSGAAGTEAGQRIGAWREGVAAWEASRAG